MLEAIIEALIEVVDHTDIDADYEDGGDAEPGPEDSPNAFCWLGGTDGQTGG